MKRATILFIAASLIIVAGVYVLIATTTPLALGQAVGVGVAFLLGWMGLAYAGSDAIRGMLRRRLARLASREAKPVRQAAFTRRFLRENPPTAGSGDGAASSQPPAPPAVKTPDRAAS